MNRAKVDYHFGDSDVAAERLRHLAEVFEPSTRQFLDQLRLPSGARIADLGCGPGHTTRLLAEFFPTAIVRGFDKSKNFIASARAVAGPRAAFEVADVTTALSGGPYELIYCRYLLTHVPDFRGAVALWSQQLAAGGYIYAGGGHYGPVGGPALLVAASLPAGPAFTFVDFALPLRRNALDQKAWVLRVGASVRVKALSF